MRIAYLVNQYPMTSLSFIRREIRCLETMEMEVLRFALRTWPEPLVEEADLEELEHTRFVQSAGPLAFLAAILSLTLRRIGPLLACLALAVRLARRTDKGLLMHLAYLAEAAVLLRWLEWEQVEHVHGHFASNPAEVLMFCRMLGGPPYSFTVHGPEDVDRAQYLPLDETVERATFVAAISDYCRSQLMRWCEPQHWPKIEVVRCALEDEYFVLRDAIAHGQKARFVSIGRLSEQKGQLVLIEAAARLKEESRDFEIVVLGDGPMRSAIETSIRRHGLQDVVKLPGWSTASQVREHLLESRALLLPSFAEGLPVVIMEAFALGRPVITTWIAGIPELVEPGINGWLVPPSNVESLARAMREALEAPGDQLRKMGMAGWDAAHEKHRLRSEVARLAGLIANRTAADRTRRRR